MMTFFRIPELSLDNLEKIENYLQDVLGHTTQAINSFQKAQNIEELPENRALLMIVLNFVNDLNSQLNKISAFIVACKDSANAQQNAIIALCHQHLATINKHLEQLRRRGKDIQDEMNAHLH